MTNEKSLIEKQTDGTIKLTITIPWEEVVKAQEKVVENAVNNAELPGFRKGKAPRKMVEEKLDPVKTQEEVLKNLLPTVYVKAIEEHKIRPIVNPKIHVEKLEKEKPWLFSATTCEAPEVDLKDYKDKIKSLTAKAKIVIPGKEPFDAAQDKTQEVKFDEIVKTLAKTVSVPVPAMLIEHEVDRLLSQLLDDIKRLGLTLDQYLSSTNRTADSLRTEYEERAKNDLTIEFAVQKIAEVEKITISDKEIEEAINKAKDDKERKNLEQNRYVLASILRQQKTLDFLRIL